MRTKENDKKIDLFSSLFPFDISKLIQLEAFKFQNVC